MGSRWRLADAGIEADEDLGVPTCLHHDLLFGGYGERAAGLGVENVGPRAKAHTEAAILVGTDAGHPATIGAAKDDPCLVGKIGAGILLGRHRALGAQQDNPIDPLRGLGAQEVLGTTPCQGKQGGEPHQDSGSGTVDHATPSADRFGLPVPAD